MVDCKHGWQFAAIEAPTATNALIRSSSFIGYRLLSDLIDENPSEKDTPSRFLEGVSSFEMLKANLRVYNALGVLEKVSTARDATGF
jgi:hypothetical protein